jgi:hypothetical protein
LLRDSLCNVYCYVDDDKAGRDGVEHARAQGLITLADVTLARCEGRAEAEAEDVYDPAVYRSVVQRHYGVQLFGPTFQNAKKWSVRVRDTFTHNGKPWSDRIEAEVKHYVAEAVGSQPTSALIPITRGAFDALVEALRERLRTLQGGPGA